MDCLVQGNTLHCQHLFTVLESERRTEVTAWPFGIIFPWMFTHNAYTYTPTTLSEHALSYLSEWFIQLLQDALLIKHLALVAVLIVVMDFLPEVCWKFVEGHVLLHLFVLREDKKIK